MWSTTAPEPGLYWVCKKHCQPTVAEVLMVEGQKMVAILNDDWPVKVEYAIEEGWAFGDRLIYPPRRTE